MEREVGSCGVEREEGSCLGGEGSSPDIAVALDERCRVMMAASKALRVSAAEAATPLDAAAGELRV